MAKLKPTFGVLVAILAILATQLFVQVFAIALAEPFARQGVTVNPDGPVIGGPAPDATDAGVVIYFLGCVVIGAVLFLLIIRKKLFVIMKLLMYLSVLSGLWFSIYGGMSFLFPGPDQAWNVACSATASVILMALLIVYPEWFVLDTVGIIVTAGIGALLGISIPPVAVLVLFAIMLCYDAFMVYKSKQMITMANAAVDQKVPALYAFPYVRGFSYLKTSSDKKTGERGAFLLGFGDTAIPAVLAVSAYFMTPGNVLPAAGAIVGTLAGAAALEAVLLKTECSHAGLPFLCTGAAIGFIVVCLATGVAFW